jgi:regulator of sigma E protease
VILSAGVAMNVVFAIIVFVIVYMNGIRFVAPVVGATQPGLPAATVVLPDEVAEAMGVEEAVGLQAGDRILTVNGKKIRRFSQVQMAAVLSDEGETFDLAVARKVKGREITFNVTLTPKKSEVGPFGEHYIFGIGRPVSTVIEEPGKEGYAGDEKFKKHDRIVEAAGEPIENFHDITPALRSGAGKEVEFVVERKGQKVHVKVKPLEISPDDIILSYAGKDSPSRAELLEINKKSADTEVSIRVLRDGETLDLKITPTKQGDAVLVGIITVTEQDKVLVASVHPDSPAAMAGVAKGSVITKINDTPVATWPQVYAALRSSVGTKVVLTYTAAGSKQKGAVKILTKKIFDPEKYSFVSPAIGAVSILKTDPIRGHPLEAIAWSAEDTTTWMISVYKSLRNIFKGRASTKGLSGPVGIGAIAVAKGREGIVDIAYFMAMLSALVAVFNFLPLPVLDGGHVVITLVEKVRGRPIPTKVMIGIQMTGWVLIGGLFLAITFQDIARHIFGKW